MGAEPEWKTPEIRAAEARLERSAEAVRELVEKIEREGLPSAPASDPDEAAQPDTAPDRTDGDSEGNIVLRDSSW
ncbi:hypothetical protein [Labedaea rhizosphaerae]|uniref:Uncharacterized protein n=1 Tax=Labedaea rhizosphaerae TaxID=598644 RepID=A0A4R6SM89_LABRH|nr:hypothetical protein [Labedaea rhizosphaerae]TDQ05626.1 hypothetical protein EV186_1011600 [Labedaea rhizosphaerae]